MPPPRRLPVGGCRGARCGRATGQPLDRTAACRPRSAGDDRSVPRAACDRRRGPLGIGAGAAHR